MFVSISPVIKSQTNNYYDFRIFFFLFLHWIFGSGKENDDATKNQSKTNTFVTFFWRVIHAHDDSEINFLAFLLTRWVAFGFGASDTCIIWKFNFYKLVRILKMFLIAL